VLVIQIPQSSLDKTLVDTIIELLRTNQGFSYFKKFYYGDPYEIHFSDMHCIAVELLRTQINDGPTGMDEIVQTVQIKLIYNKRDDFTTAPTTEVTGVRALESFAQGFDPTSTEYEQHTILGILRKNFTLGNIATNQTVDIKYGIVPRKGGPTAECHITFVVDELKTVSSRL
jgi:hypothetical protein